MHRPQTYLDEEDWEPKIGPSLPVIVESSNDEPVAGISSSNKDTPTMSPAEAAGCSTEMGSVAGVVESMTEMEKSGDLIQCTICLDEFTKSELKYHNSSSCNCILCDECISV